MGACENCPRKGERKGQKRNDPKGKWAGSSGPVDSSLLIVGMAPGFDELIVGKPFVGGSGRLLAAALSHNNYDIKNARLVNVINCYPMGKGDSISKAQWDACRNRLAKDIYTGSIRTILCLGSDALRAITGYASVTEWRGYIINVPTDDHVIATYHPSAVMRSGLKWMPYFIRDVGRAVRWSRGEHQGFWRVCSKGKVPSPGSTLGIDIETS